MDFDLFLYGRVSTRTRRARLALLTWLRIRDEFVEGWEEWLQLFPVVSARKKASELIRSLCLMKMLTQATMEDGELREKLGYRRSSRISPLALPAPSALGIVRLPDLPPIVEAMDSNGEQAEVSNDVVDVLRVPSPLSRDDEPHSLLCPVSASLIPLPGEVTFGADAQGGLSAPEESGTGSLVADKSPQPPVDLVSSTLSPLLVESREMINSMVDNSGVVFSSLVGASVEVVEELAILTVGGQRVPVAGWQQQPPLPTVGHGGCGVPEVCGQRVFPCDVDHQVSGGDRGSDGGIASGEGGGGGSILRLCGWAGSKI
ncbi:hypothetical protein Dimus_006055 [Dionaea muscipula]